MNLKILLASLAAVAAGAGAVAYTQMQPSPDEMFLTSCEETLKERLRSLSTYNRLEVFVDEPRQASLDEYLGWTDPDRKADDERQMAEDEDIRSLHEFRVQLYGDGSYTNLMRALIKYEAANAYGTPIVGAAECTETYHGENYEPSIAGPRINGTTNVEWLIEQL